MSSRSPIRSERHPLRAAALTLMLSALPYQAPAPAEVQLPVTAVLTAAGQTSLVVDLSASSRPGPRTVSVTLDGKPQKARLVPVMSDGLAVALVVDSSAAGAASLPAWLSAAARFILEAPPSTRAVVITDTTPATVVTGPQSGATGVIQALDSVRAAGDRDTGAALALATRQFPDAPAGRRVVVLYTGAVDAGGVSAASLAARLRATGTILVAVGTAAADTYWTDAAAASGGFFAPAGDPVVMPALDQVETTLSGRYLVQFPAPPTLPAQVSVQVQTADVTLTGDVEVEPPLAPAAAPSRSRGRTILLAVLIVAGVAALAVLVAGLLPRLRRRPAPAPHRPQPAPSQPSPPPAAENRLDHPAAAGSRTDPSTAAGDITDPSAAAGSRANASPADASRNSPPAAARGPSRPAATWNRTETEPPAATAGRTDPRAPSDTADPHADPPPMARGRASIPRGVAPNAVARGRAVVPETGPKDDHPPES
jgi:hypothetical protein